jgi:hypothetical protein
MGVFLFKKLPFDFFLPFVDIFYGIFIKPGIVTGNLN